MSNTPQDQKAHVERIAHIRDSICLRWGTQELDRYINDLLLDARDGDRQGFPMEIADELLFLRALNKVRRALVAQNKTGASFQEVYRLVEVGDYNALYSKEDPWTSPNGDTKAVIKDMLREEEQRIARQQRQAG